MKSFLDTIIECKNKEQKAIENCFGHNVPGLQCQHTPVSMSETLKRSKTGIIAEFKRRSPSKGEIHPMADVSIIVPGYENAGASAVSILTDTCFFGGSVNDLMVARQKIELPILRKDFIVTERQIVEARAIGADAILIIAACTTPLKVRKFTEVAHSLGLEVLLEIHNEKELDRYFEGIDMVGVNNRDLTTFNTDPGLSYKAAELLPKEVVKVAESGLTDMRQVMELRQLGYQGFLIGETFMKEENPPKALRDFINVSQ